MTVNWTFARLVTSAVSPAGKKRKTGEVSLSPKRKGLHLMIVEFLTVYLRTRKVGRSFAIRCLPLCLKTYIFQTTTMYLLSDDFNAELAPENYQS
jgi:hypothetical protein